MVRGKTKETVATDEPKDMSMFLRKVEEIPTFRKKTGSVYFDLVMYVAKQKGKVNFEIKLKDLSEGKEKETTWKTAYPSLEKAIHRLAEMNGVDFSKPTPVKNSKGEEYKTYPKFDEWKERNMRLRKSGDKIYLEKIVERPL